MLGALAAPIDPVHIEALRRQRRELVSQELLVRVNLESRAASAGGRNGLARLPTTWSVCRCMLLSDRQLQISRPAEVGGAMGGGADKGELLGTIDLRSAFNVHLVLVPAHDGPGAGDLSCLQVRTSRLVYEFRAETRGGLAKWREPLEQMLMLQLTSRQQGWLHLLQPEAQSQVRCFLDLSSTGSQLRFLQNSLRPARAALGFIELAELQSVQLLQGSPSYCRTIAALADATHVLELSGASHTWLLSSNDMVGLRRWASQLRRAHQQALLAMHHFSTMVLLDGWLEFKGDNDEWSRGFFMLTIGAGLQCFEHEPDEQVSLQPLETLPLEQISCAVRAKGIDFYDWCIDVETVERDYIRVRPPSQAAMTRWLSAINLYCNPLPALPVEQPQAPPPAGGFECRW